MNEKKKTSILILDDETIVIKRLKPALEKTGYEVEAFPRVPRPQGVSRKGTSISSLPT
jgi:ActR/RegA family two-component response regulator